MIGPHLKPENHAEVLARAKFRTKKELTKLVRDLNPLPDVPDRMEPLGAEREPMLSTRNPSWERFVATLSPHVRELPADQQPCNWANDGVENAHDDLEHESATSAQHAALAPNTDVALPDDETLPVGPVPSDLPPVTGPQLFQMQFGTVEEHVQLVDRAKALLARDRPRVTLGELHLEAMKLFVAGLEKRKFALKDRPCSGTPSTPRQHPVQSATDSTSLVSVSELQPHRTEAPRQRVDASTLRGATADTPRASGDAFEVEQPSNGKPCQRVAETEVDESATGTLRQRVAATEDHAPKMGCGVDVSDDATGTGHARSRYVPAAVRREVYQRDGACCTYIDTRGRRCCETHYLELHHLQPFAKDGDNVASNLTLRCAAHNALAAEADFGGKLMAARRHSTRHESIATLTRNKKRP